eukprot:scaffold2366_cov115-Cylindrotheca_fusiformis.AAC.6
MAVSSSSSINYNVYNYDMATPQFTPDGRLLQVEYASVAAEQSSPLLALQLKHDTIVLIAIKNSNTQNRMALLMDPQNPVCVAMSGVLADSVALLQGVLEESSNNRKRYNKELTILQVANVIAKACQQNSFGGGIRPYGSTMMVCGFCDAKQPVLYQTDPSGAILEAPCPETPNQVRWMIGGSQSLQRQLKQRINQALGRSPLDSSMADMIVLASRILIKETRKANKETKDKGAPASLEVVVLSPSLGGQRLTEEQLNAIQERISAKK